MSSQSLQATLSNMLCNNATINATYNHSKGTGQSSSMYLTYLVNLHMVMNDIRHAMLPSPPLPMKHVNSHSHSIQDQEATTGNHDPTMLPSHLTKPLHIQTLAAYQMTWVILQTEVHTATSRAILKKYIHSIYYRHEHKLTYITDCKSPTYKDHTPHTTNTCFWFFKL